MGGALLQFVGFRPAPWLLVPLPVVVLAGVLPAAGRLFGVLLSGLLAQYGRLEACLWGSAAMLVACTGLTFVLPLQSEARRVAV